MMTNAAVWSAATAWKSGPDKYEINYILSYVMINTVSADSPKTFMHLVLCKHCDP